MARTSELCGVCGADLAGVVSEHRCNGSHVGGVAAQIVSVYIDKAQSSFGALRVMTRTSIDGRESVFIRMEDDRYNDVAGFTLSRVEAEGLRDMLADALAETDE